MRSPSDDRAQLTGSGCPRSTTPPSRMAVSKKGVRHPEKLLARSKGAAASGSNLFFQRSAAGPRKRAMVTAQSPNIISALTPESMRRGREHPTSRNQPSDSLPPTAPRMPRIPGEKPILCADSVPHKGVAGKKTPKPLKIRTLGKCPATDTQTAHITAPLHTWVLSSALFALNSCDKNTYAIQDILSPLFFWAEQNHSGLAASAASTGSHMARWRPCGRLHRPFRD
jgi:hypothetical protein